MRKIVLISTIHFFSDDQRHQIKCRDAKHLSITLVYGVTLPSSGIIGQTFTFRSTQLVRMRTKYMSFPH